MWEDDYEDDYISQACRGCQKLMLLISSESKRMFCPHCIRERNAAQRRIKRQRVASLACQRCGATFTPPRSDARYCSSACRQAAYRERKVACV